ncbi:TPA: sugar ABC transporter substrate-binding protein [Listeria monocytogenes]|nr:extracellular solute-binding protein [Listeria monocytogenes]EAC2956003.1 extracellular solute-binding protein [Listeria monocytogenes]
MKKKMFVVLALVLSLSLVLMACGGSKDDANSGDSKVLNVWAMGDEAKSLKELAQKFTKDTGIEVKVQVIPCANAHDKLLTAVASKSGPDVVQMGTTWMPEFVEAGALLDITKDVEKSKNMNSDLFFPGSVKTTQFDGKTYGVPWYAETRVLFYRTDLLKKVGYNEAPKTWDELSDAALKLSKRGKDMYGFAIDPNEQTTGFIFGRQNGSPLFDKDGQPVFNKKPFVDTVSYLDSFIKNGSAPDTDLGLDASQSFGGDGIVPMFMSGPWMVNTLKDTAPDIDGKWATAVLPKKENNESSLGGANLSIFKYSDKKDDALKFMDYMSQPDVQLSWLKDTNSMPARMDAWEDDMLKNDPYYKVFGEQMKTAEPMPLIPQFEEIAQLYGKSWEQIYRGGADVQTQMDTFNDQVEALLKK